MNILEKAAEVLIECGYAMKVPESILDILSNKEHNVYLDKPIGNGKFRLFVVNTFEDTLEGRKQADAIEDWLYRKADELWTESVLHNAENGIGLHQWRLDRIKWCLEQLIEKEENDKS